MSDTEAVQNKAEEEARKRAGLVRNRLMHLLAETPSGYEGIAASLNGRGGPDSPNFKTEELKAALEELKTSGLVAEKNIPGTPPTYELTTEGRSKYDRGEKLLKVTPRDVTNLIASKLAEKFPDANWADQILQPKTDRELFKR